MSHALHIAQDLAKSLNSVGYECTLENTTITILKWGVRIGVFEGEEKSDRNVRVSPTIDVYHRFLRKMCSVKAWTR